MIDKSKEAFSLGIEIYNKPTIKYRVEGFAFFICNAWELMLKAYLIKKLGQSSIYYKNKKDRTISLSECIKKVFTNNKDPLRLNLEKIKGKPVKAETENLIHTIGFFILIALMLYITFNDILKLF